MPPDDVPSAIQRRPPSPTRPLDVRNVRPVQRTAAPILLDDGGLPIVVALPKLLWCVSCQQKFDPKITKAHARHFVRDHHPRGDRHGAVSSDDTSINAADAKHRATGIDGFDLVTGGGLVDESAIILGGTTGCGKSTIAAEVCFAVCSRLRGTVLYASAEETVAQVLMRLRACNLAHKNLKVVHTSSMEDIERHIAEIKPHLVVYDSLSRINTMRARDAKVGSVAAMTTVTERIIHISKKSKLHPIAIAICHENKDGDIAGPKAVQHDFDVILHFQRDGALRRLECEKDRFGPAPVSATFEFKGNRLVEVKDAAAQILPTVTGGVGCLLFPMVHGLKIEVLPVEVFASERKGEDEPKPRQSAQGVTEDRFNDVVAALAEHTVVSVEGRSVRGKVRRAGTDGNVGDPAVDAALAFALASAVERRAIPQGVAVFGEFSPSGRLEVDPSASARIAAAKASGARVILGPFGSPATEGIVYHAIADIGGLVRWLIDNCEHVALNAERVAKVNSERRATSAKVLAHVQNEPISNSDMPKQTTLLE